MSDRSIVFWFIAGFFISVVDAWLSVQSMFGLIDPASFAGYSFAIISGILLTASAVYVPILRSRNTSRGLVAVWLVLLSFDVATSIVGAIWYGVLGNPLNSSVQLSTLHFELANWPATVVFVVFVLVVVGCCVRFGQALNALNRKRNRWRETRVSDRTSRYTKYRSEDFNGS